MSEQEVWGAHGMEVDVAGGSGEGGPGPGLGDGPANAPRGWNRDGTDRCQLPKPRPWPARPEAQAFDYSQARKIGGLVSRRHLFREPFVGIPGPPPSSPRKRRVSWGWPPAARRCHSSPWGPR